MGGDSRTYIKMSDTLPEHRKIVAVGGDAAWLHVCALAYSSRNLTDGVIPDAVVPRLSDRRQPGRLAAKLTEVGLWHAAGHGCKRCPQPHPGEYVIHDYLVHQRSAAKVEEIRHKRADAGREGGTRKAARTKQPSSKLLAGCNEGAVAKPTPVSEEVLRTSQTVSETDQELPPTAAHDPKQTASNLLDTAPTAQTILGSFIDWVRGEGGELTKRTTGQLAKQIGDLVSQGVPDRHIRQGLADWHASGQHPSTLDSFVNAAVNAAARGRTAQNGTGRSTGAARAQEPLAAGQRVQRLIDEGKLQL